MRRSRLGLIAGRIFLVLILVTLVVSKVNAQVVPPVGPAGCVALCGGGVGGFSPGGMMGGMAAAIIGAMIMSAVAAEMQKQSVTAPGQQPQGPKRFPYQRPRTYQASDPVQEAMEQQRRFHEERERKILETMIDSPTLQLAESTAKMDLLKGDDETVSFKAGCSFDRGDCTDPGSLWMESHDAWFSTAPVGITQSQGAQPLKVSEQPLNYSQQNFEPIRCTGPIGPYGGKLCPFPNMRVSAVKLETIEVPPPQSPPGASDIISQFSESRGRFISAFRRTWSNVTTPKLGSPDFLFSNFVDWGNDKALSGLQLKIAKQGQNAYRSVSLRMAEHIFKGLNQAAVNPDATIEMFEPETLQGVIQDAAGKSLPGPAKGAYLALTERYEEAIETLKRWSEEGVKGRIQGFYKGQAKDLAGRSLLGEFHKQHWLAK